MGKKLIGRTDRATFPELGLTDIAIKIDTGAYTSSIHCTEIVEKEGILSCLFLDEEHTSYNKKRFTFTDYDRVMVKSSNGIAEERYVVTSAIQIYDTIYTIKLTLSNRSDMRYPVLIGRKFLSGKFIVDPQLQDLSVKSENEDYEH